MRKSKVLISAIVYLALGIGLFYPNLKSFKTIQYLIIFNSAAGALGCFILSRRWMSTYPASLFAGAVYGFSPFALGFAAYHPIGGSGLAILPWLFLPAAFFDRFFGPYRQTLPRTLAAAVLAIAPFIVIGAFFWLMSTPLIGPFFPLPKHQKLGMINMIGLAAPLALRPHDFIFGFYHIPTTIGLMGLFIYVKVHRLSTIIILALGIILSLADSILQISPIVWALVPALFCSLLIGLGIQGLAWAGRSDTKWILICAIVAIILAGMTFLLSLKYGGPYLEAARMHSLAAILLASIFFIARAQIRWHPLRWFLLCTGIAIDILITSRHIINGL